MMIITIYVQRTFRLSCPGREENGTHEKVHTKSETPSSMVRNYTQTQTRARTTHPRPAGEEEESNKAEVRVLR